MTRITLDGEGEPIPTEALPSALINETFPVLLTFTEDTTFNVEEYIALGFTHFEVWCVGAAGGRGGDAGTKFDWVEDPWTTKSVPSDIWAEYKNFGNLENVDPDIIQYADPTFSGDVPTEYGQTVTQHYSNWGQVIEHANPSHWVRQFNLIEPFIREPEVPLGLGGGGGGGGFHISSGVLADLPSSVPITVGQAGGDAGYGQVKVYPTLVTDGSVWRRDRPKFTPTELAAASGVGLLKMQYYNYFIDYLTSYPEPKEFPNPQPGEDGGASTFADTLCCASGGKGGEPGSVFEDIGPTWVNGVRDFFEISGHGGQGGAGDRTAAGGGASGSISPGSAGSDGTWDGEIGEGGGGGCAGRPGAIVSIGGGRTEQTYVLASSGGRGSFSSGAPAVHGEKHTRSEWIRKTRSFRTGAPLRESPGDVWLTEARLGPNYYIPAQERSWLYPNAPGYNLAWVPSNGQPSGTYNETLVPTGKLLIPGGGGGARPFPTVKAGSRASGYSPNGVVLVRVSKIE